MIVMDDACPLCRMDVAATGRFGGPTEEWFPVREPSGAS